MKKITLILGFLISMITSFGQINLPLDFEASVNYNFTNFDGGVVTVVDNPQPAGVNTSAKVAKMVKSPGQVWGGSFISLANPIDFSTNRLFKMKVWSPRVGAKVLLKVENNSNASVFFEKQVLTTVANTWEELSFDYSAISTSNQYQKLVFIFENGTNGDGSANFTFYFDELRLTSGGGGTPTLTQMNLPVTFDDATVDYGLIGFGGAEQSTIVTDPTLATNKCAKVIKTATAELWAGTTVTAAAGLGFATAIPFTATNTKMSVRVWSPHAGIPVRLKAEEHGNGSHSVETEATVTTANGWQTLEFNFANQSAGTAALNLSYTYDKVSIFFNFGTTGATAGERTYYFDDVKFVTGGGTPTLTQMNLPVTFDDATVDYGLIGFGGAEQSTIVTDPTLATNKCAKVIKTATAELWAGTTVTAAAGLGFATAIPFTATNTKMSVRVWSPHAGIPVRLKAEEHGNGSHSVETEATVTTANGWQTLEFNFANQSAGTAALNLSYTYDKVSIFFNFGTTGATAGERTYYFDDVKFVTGGGTPTLTQMNLPVTFDDATVDYGLIGFGGAEQSTIVTDPTLATNKCAKVIKTATAELWAGTTVTAAAGLGFATAIPFTATNTKMSVRVWSPHAGIPVRLKVEEHGNGSHSVETEATVTTANGWQTLEFNFANQSAGTAALNLSYTYDKVSIFFNFGTTGATAGERTYYFDDVKFVTGGGTPTLTQMNLPVTFDDATVDYGLIGFGGAEQSTIVTDPTLATNKCAKVIKTATAELWAGTTVTAAAGLGFATAIPFTATNTKMSVRVWSPHAGISVRLKVEEHGNGTHSVETEATVTTANGWQTLEFNFANQSAGTAALNLSYTYDKVSIFFNFGTTGATAGERTYYFDDVKFVTGGGTPTQMNLPVTFDDATVDYGLIGFGGAEQSTIVTDPTLATNKCAKVIKTATAELWAGTTVTAAAGLGFATAIPFTATNTKMSVRVWSPHAGIPVRLKAEEHGNGSHSVETEATVTTANGWQTLEFNFANQSAGTAALNLSYTYDKVSIFFNFGTTGATAGERTYYFDDVKFVTGGGTPTLTQMNLPVTFDDATVDYGLIGFGGAEQSTIVTDPTLATNKCAKVIKTATAELWAGTTVTAAAGLGFATAIPFTATNTKMSVRVWSPHAGIPVRLKAEEHGNGSHSVETEATVTTANGWQTLEFNFANQSAGTAALNLSYTYDKVSIFFNFGTTGATAGERTYYFDDVKFVTGGGTPTLTQMNLPVTFDDATVDYGFIGFGGAEQSTIVTDPTLATNKCAKVIKTATAELWAGTTVTAAAGLGFATAIPFTATNTKMSVRVWSPHAGIPVRLKVEEHGNGSHSVETEATVTTANGWQTLEFNFANQSAGTAALNLSYTYDKVSIFFNFGTTGATAGERTYYFDDVKFVTGGGTPTLTQMNLPVTFDDATVDYGLIGFGGAEQSTIVTDPTLATNKCAKVIKTATAELWAGTTVTAAAGLGFATAIPFTATNTKMSVRVWSPHAGISVRLKVEEHGNGTHSVETEATVTTANGWQTLEFNFANQSAGTAALNLSYTYDKVSIFFNFGTTGATAGERTYYFDDVKFVTGGTTPTAPTLPLDFESPSVNYTFTDFDGGGTTVISNPFSTGINTSSKVAKMVKSTGQTWGGSFIELAGPIDFSTNRTFKMKVYAPRVGAKVLLKVENSSNASISYEREVLTTTANAWEDLIFDYSAINTTNQYHKVVFIFDNGTMGDGSANYTYYFDELRLTAAPPPVLTQMNLPVTFDDATVEYGLIGFGGAEQSTIVTDPTLATNKCAKVIKTATAELWAGTTVTATAGLGFATAIPFTATNTKMSVRVWSPHAGIPVRLKVEDHAVASHSVETEATVTTASGWQTLEFDFANQAAGTAALNLTYRYDKASIFFNFGTTGAIAGEKTYYFDDVKFVPGGGISIAPQLPLTFQATNVNYSFTNFDGGNTTIVNNPSATGINTSTKVAKMVKNAGQVWGGSWIAMNAPIDFSIKRLFKVKVYAPRAGAKLLLKVENATDATINFEKETTTTVANTWEELSFDFNDIDINNEYHKIVFIFDNGTAGDGSPNFTYYFDDVQLVIGGGTGPVLSQMDLPLTFDDASVNYGFIGSNGAEQSSVVTDPTLATNKVAKVIRSATAGVDAGTAITASAGLGFANKVPFTTTRTRMSVRVWAADAGVKVRLKLAEHGDATHVVEAEATTTVANQWQTVEFDFANHVGASAIDFSYQYDLATIYFQYGKTGAEIGEKTFYFDDVKFINIAPSLEPDQVLNQISVYPNPTAEKVKISNITETPLNIQVVDIHGKTVKQLFSNVSVVEIDMTNLSAGYYILNIQNKLNNQRTSRKIIKL